MVQCSSRVLGPTTMCVALVLILVLVGAVTEARVTFEKMTNRDYSGQPYYTIQNVSLFECLGWCKEEISCTSAVFSFVVNPFAALQETTCVLQNDTQARQGAYTRTNDRTGEPMTVVAQPSKATNLYFFNKIELQSEALCQRLWAFERFPNRRLRQRDRQSFHAQSKEQCQSACMSETRFVCRSLEYNYITQQCTLSAYDRRLPLVQHLASTSVGSSHGANDLTEAAGTDYFENACLLGEDICNEVRIYDYAKVGLPLQRVAHFVELNYYPDKEMLVKSQAGCLRACTIEHEFICRSILFRSSFKQGQPNCALYHLDQRTFPEGSDAFMTPSMQPLLDSGETSAVYLEAVCNDTIHALPMTSSSSISSGSSSSSSGTTIAMPSTITIMPSSTTPNGISVHPGPIYQQQQQHQNTSDHERYIGAASTSTLSPIGPPTTIRVVASNGNNNGNNGYGPPSMPTTLQISDSSTTTSGIHMPTRVTIGSTPPRPSIPDRITISPAPPPREPGFVNGNQMTITAVDGHAQSQDHNCDLHGFCYDVSLKCTDTKMVVNVKTQRPFHGRIYALGRSETCNSNVRNQNQFQLDMYLTGQECNTQSASGTYTNTIVLQHHNVVLTKADKVYHVRCTYETASRNVSFGMMPVKDMFEVDVNDRNQETISITASSDAPLPKISILTLDGKEASTVRIGDRLTFRIEIPDNTPYGIFARSCTAMAKDGRSTFEIVDEHGCPVDHTIFPQFIPMDNGNALVSNYEAFRFTESYGVIFQCNVKYCIGKCEPVSCGIGRDSVEAWGRKKRSIGANNSNNDKKSAKQLGGDDMTLSREIVVLDLKAKDENGGSLDASESDGDSSAQKSPLRSANQQQASSSSSSSSFVDDPSQQQQQQQMDASNSPDSTTSSSQQTNKHCLSSQSLFVLICSIGLFFVLYVCVVAYFFARRYPKISPIKHQFH